jgi:hypothetical protein
VTHANLIEKIAKALDRNTNAQAEALDEEIGGVQIDFCPEFMELARAALTAIEEAGFVAVPREPTVAMAEAGFRAAGSISDIYRAMIAQAEKEGL